MNKYKYILSLFLFVLAGCYNHTSDEYVTGRVVKILDGDTYDLLLENNTTIRIRMDGIDAPEKGMPFSKASKRHLGELCQGQTIKVSKSQEDQYGRIVGFSYLEDGRELGHEMLKAGLAWHYKQYNSDPELATLENEARQAQIGLWKDKNPMAPWENRKLHRQGISTKGTYQTVDEEMNTK
jgi:endonuclease YncB( thermonuclease family)